MFMPMTAVKSDVSEWAPDILRTGFTCLAVWSPVENTVTGKIPIGG